MGQKLSKIPPTCRPSATELRRAAPGILLALAVVGFSDAPRAAPIVVDNARTTTVTLGTGDSLQITDAGSIETDNNGVSADLANIGPIHNAGKIESGDDAVFVFRSDVAGDISNATAALIDTQTRSGDNGIELRASTMAGSISNAGRINAASDGVQLVGATLDGGITNTTLAQITAENGIVLDTGSSVTGPVSNYGTITATTDGIKLTGSSSVRGISNSISSIAGGSTGIALLSDAQVNGSIVNDGNISGDTFAGVSIAFGASVTGDIINRGNIDGGFHGLSIGSGTIQGTVTNNGTISGNRKSINGASTEAIISGGIVNNGTLAGQVYLMTGTSIDLTNHGDMNLGSNFAAGYFESNLISGSFSQSSSGSLALTLMSFTQYGSNSALLVGNAVLDGELVLGFDPGFSFEPATRMSLLTLIQGGTASRTGVFSNYADDDLVASFGTGQNIYIDYTDDGDIELYASGTGPSPTPLPATWLLIGVGLFGLRAFGARRD